MLKALRDRSLMIGTAEVLANAVRYIAVVLVGLLLLGQIAKDQLPSGWTTMTAIGGTRA